MRVLFVCTGNQCRSPVAERLWRNAARGMLGSGTPGVHASSAGLTARGGERMDPSSAEALRRLGGDDDGFAARPFSAEEASEADLVLTMTRDQRHAVLRQTPRGLRRTFTLREAAALAELADLTGLADLPLAVRARELAARLDAARRHRSSRGDDDIADPVGRRAAVHRETAALIAGALQPLTAALFGDVRDAAEAPAPRPLAAGAAMGALWPPAVHAGGR